MNCVLSEIEYIKKENACYDNSYVKKLSDSYGYGFTAGVQEAFQEQQAKNNQAWGLVLVMPKEVKEAVENWKRQKFKNKAQSQENISSQAYTQGYHQGKAFNPTKRLAADDNMVG